MDIERRKMYTYKNKSIRFFSIFLYVSPIFFLRDHILFRITSGLTSAHMQAWKKRKKKAVVL